MKGMTNNQIIMNEAAKLDPATLHAIATAHHTPEQIAAMAANAVTTDENGDEQPATTKKPAPDVLRKAEREAKAAFLAVPETDRKGQSAALDAWRKTRKAVEDAKQAPAAVAAPDEAPVKQLDFESIAAGLLA